MDVWQLATELGLTVVERHGVHQSGYAPGSSHVVLRPGMRGRVLRSVLAHEIGHHVLGHRPTGFGPMRKRQEHQANEWAAHQLITPVAYAEAERLRGPHVSPIAFELNVSEELVAVYQQTLLRTDLATYVRPRLGAGCWDHRVEVR